jgi:hypothetical protein
MPETPTPAEPNDGGRRWNAQNVHAFPDEVCANCDESLFVGQHVREHPPLSLCFYHTDPDDCFALRET